MSKYTDQALRELLEETRILVKEITSLASGRLARAEQERDEWKKEAELRGLPKELMKRLHAAEWRVEKAESLAKALEESECWRELQGRPECPPDSPTKCGRCAALAEWKQS